MADNEPSTTATTATVAAEPSKPPETKRWADVADEEADSVTESTNLDSLAIDESRQGENTLEDLDDCRIEAVIISITE